MKSAGGSPGRAPDLAGVVSDVLLAPDAALLLRACLFEGEQWQAAWRDWRARSHDPNHTFANRDEALKGLLPVLFVAARRGGLSSEPAFLTHLRAAYFRESIRFTGYSKVCREVLSILSGASVDAIVLRGNALAETVYPEAGVRHSNGLTLWLRDRTEVGRAVDLLTSNGLQMADGSDELAWTRTLVHSSLMQVFLQSDLFPGSHYRPPQAAIRERSRRSTIAGVEAAVLSPHDSLLEVCGRAVLRHDRDSLRWACDAWLLVANTPDLNWDALTETTVESGMALPLFVTLRYLSAELGAAVPDGVLERLSEAAHQDPLSCELTLRSLQRAEGLSLIGAVFRPSRWADRAAVARRLLLPSPEYMRWRVDLPVDAPVAPLYLRRFRNFVFQRFSHHEPGD